MSSSDFRLTESIRAAFTCERGTVQFYFVVADKDVGKRFLYTLEEVAPSGNESSKLGLGTTFRAMEFPLRSYGISANACGITAGTAVQRGLASPESSTANADEACSPRFINSALGSGQSISMAS